MRKGIGVVLATLAALAAASAAFFGVYGVRLVVFVATPRDEGSLGHVGAIVAAGLFPVLALVSAAIAWFAGRAAWRRLRS